MWLSVQGFTICLLFIILFCGDTNSYFEVSNVQCFEGKCERYSCDLALACTENLADDEQHLIVGADVNVVFDISLLDNLVLDRRGLVHDRLPLQLPPLHLLLHHRHPQCHPHHSHHPQLCLLEVPLCSSSR